MGDVGTIETVSAEIIVHGDVNNVHTVSGDVSLTNANTVNTVSGSILQISEEV